MGRIESYHTMRIESSDQTVDWEFVFLGGVGSQEHTMLTSMKQLNPKNPNRSLECFFWVPIPSEQDISG